MAQVSSSGVASGLDVNSIVKQLVLIERKPIDVAQQKQIAIVAKLSSFTTLGVSFVSLKSTLKSLQSFTSFQAKSASSTDSSAITATVNDSKLAVVGSSTVGQVISLARAQKLASGLFTAPTSTVGTGTIKIKVGSGAQISIAIDTKNASLTQIRDKINFANAGVTASVLKSNDKQYKLVLQSAKSGIENTIQVEIVDDDSDNADASGLSQLANLTEIQSAKDAEFLLDGATITRSSNTITDAMDGVTLTLLKKTSVDADVAINIAPNVSALKGNIEAFVTAYNEAIKGLNTAQTFDARTKKGGPLLGNPAVQSMSKILRLIPRERVSNLEGTYASLSEIGITSQEDGTFAIDSVKLTMVIEKDPLAVGRVFALYDTTVDSSVVIPTSGIADRLFKELSNLLNEATGRFPSEQRGLSNTSALIDKEVARLEERSARFEKITRDKFARLEVSLSRIQGVGSALGRQITQLENLTSFISRRNSNSSSASTSSG
jgi:flagellar hook-associated protein 2